MAGKHSSITRTWQAGLAGVALIWAEVGLLTLIPRAAAPAASAAFLPLGAILSLAYLWQWERDRHGSPRSAIRWGWSALGLFVAAWITISLDCGSPTLRFLPFGPSCADMPTGKHVICASAMFCASVGAQAHAFRLACQAWLQGRRLRGTA